VPNTRVQRTRSSPSAPRSPLTRCPLGRRLSLLVLSPATLFAVAAVISAARLQASESGEAFVTIGGVTLGQATFHDIQARLGQTVRTRASDPHDEQLCYVMPGGTAELLFVTNDLGGSERVLIGFELRELSGASPTSCLQLSPALAKPFESGVSGIRLGMSRAKFLAVVGQPVKASRRRVIREFARQEPRGDRTYDIVIIVEGEFRDESLASLSVSKTETW
jgi:RNase P protein component